MSLSGMDVDEGRKFIRVDCCAVGATRWVALVFTSDAPICHEFIYGMVSECDVFWHGGVVGSVLLSG